MSSSKGDWAALGSGNERLVRTAGESELRSAAPEPGPARWAELDSQRERLIDVVEPLGGLPGSRRQTSELRLAVRAA
jgi:hypothetical protein